MVLQSILSYNINWSLNYISPCISFLLLHSKLHKWAVWNNTHLLAVCVLIIQSCLTVCNPMDWSPPGSYVHGILQTKIMVWVAISSSRGSSQPKDWTSICHIVGRLFTVWATREALIRCTPQGWTLFWLRISQHWCHFGCTFVYRLGTIHMIWGSVPCNCGTDVSISLLAAFWRPFSASGWHSHSLLGGPLLLQNQQQSISFSWNCCHTLNLFRKTSVL